MREYFIHNGKKQEGTFTLEDLQKRGITKKTMVWFETLPDWTEAQFIPDLEKIAMSLPPPYKPKSPDIENSGQEKSTRDSIFKPKVIVPMLIGIVAIVLFFLYTSRKDSTSDSNPLDSLVVTKQQGSAFFSKYDNNWKVEISGQMLNKSSVCKYKDFVIKADFLTTTSTLITTKNYTIYQFIDPLEKKDFYARLSGDVPSGSDYYAIRWTLIGATQVKEKKRDN